MSSVALLNQEPDYRKLRPRSVVVHNIYELETTKVKDPTQPGGFFEVSRFGQLKQSAELVDFTTWEVEQTLGLGADSFTITFPNFDGKYTGVFRSGEEIAVYVGYPVNPDNYVASDLTQMIIGRIDDVDFSFDKDQGEVVVVSGRNYAAPFLDNRVSKKYENRTATQIIDELVRLYGFGVTTSVQITNDRKFNKTVVTRSADSASILKKHNADAHTDISDSQLVLGKTKGVTKTPEIIANVVGNNSTCWEIFENLAAALADPKTGKEYKVYVEGKVLYFGPRQDTVSPTVTLTYGVDTTSINLRESTQFLKTRIIMRQYSEKKKGTYDIIIPDDLGPDVLSPKEKQDYLNLRRRYGTIDELVKDSHKMILGDVKKAKIVGLAKLRESARLVYSGSVEFAGVEDITKEGVIRVQGIPDKNGAAQEGFPYKLSMTLNALYYIEGSKHTYGKEDGYRTQVQLSTRRADRQRQSDQTASAPEISASRNIETTS